MNTVLVGQDGSRISKQLLTVRGKKTAGGTPYCLATALLLAVTAVSVMAQTKGIPGSDQSGDASTYLSLQAKAALETDAGTGNSDPEGLYNWANSYNFKSRAISSNTGSDPRWAVPANQPELLSIEGSKAGLYLSLATTKFEEEFGSANSNRDYSWRHLYESSAKVPYSSSRIAADGVRPVVVSAGVPAATPTDEGSIAEIPNPAGGVEPADATLLSLMNK